MYIAILFGAIVVLPRKFTSIGLNLAIVPPVKIGTEQAHIVLNSDSSIQNHVAVFDIYVKITFRWLANLMKKVKNRAVRV